MYKAIDFERLPGFSHLFYDFIKDNPFFDNRFPSNNKLFKDSANLRLQSESFPGRIPLTQAIKLSMENVELNIKQKQNLNIIEDQHTLCTTTGQQVGFLGGPLYTFYKINDAILIAEKLREAHQELNFVPIFWIEDNDHDNFEASQIALLTKDYEIKQVTCCPDCSKTDRTIVAKRKFNPNINEILEHSFNSLTKTEFTEHLNELFSTFYNSDKLWSDSFVELINWFFGNEGLLIVRASVMREMGLFAELATKELENYSKSNLIIEVANQKLGSSDYHIQAKSSAIYLFIHFGDKRYKIKPIENSNDFDVAGKHINLNDLAQISRTDSAAFSPNVLLRPIFQDYVLPNVVYIGGPSEIGYMAQVKELYEYFNVKMPAILQRHSATLLNMKIQRFLEIHNIEPEYFTKKYSEIEHELNLQLLDKEVETLISHSKTEVEHIFENLVDQAKKIDKSLEMSGMAHREKILHQFNEYGKKILSSQRKSNSAYYKKYIDAAQTIYPQESLQERIFSPLVFINMIGIDSFRTKLKELFGYSDRNHYFMKL